MFLQIKFAMLGSEISLLEKEIALFENERYSPISGWSKRGLMPTDRGNFSNDDGSESFSTMEEASESFLSPGWKWKHDEWDMVKGSYCDENGWSYSPDFGSFDKTPGSAIKGMVSGNLSEFELQFVIYFIVDAFCSAKKVYETLNV